MKAAHLLFFLLIVLSHAEAQNRFIKTYKFGDYSVRTGYCKDGASIKIFKGAKPIYDICGGDETGYVFIDTIMLNADNVPDFVYLDFMEEYATVGLLVSTPTKPFYKSIDLTDLWDPYTYDTSLKQAKHSTIKELLLTDVNKDGKRDLLTNVLQKNGKLYPIKHWTDTFYNKQLIQIANGAPYKAKSRAVFLDR